MWPAIEKPMSSCPAVLLPACFLYPLVIIVGSHGGGGAALTAHKACALEDSCSSL